MEVSMRLCRRNERGATFFANYATCNRKHNMDHAICGYIKKSSKKAHRAF